METTKCNSTTPLCYSTILRCDDDDFLRFYHPITMEKIKQKRSTLYRQFVTFSPTQFAAFRRIFKLKLHWI